MLCLLTAGFLHLFSTSGENVTFNQFSAETEFATVGAIRLGVKIKNVSEASVEYRPLTLNMNIYQLR